MGRIQHDGETNANSPTLNQIIKYAASQFRREWGTTFDVWRGESHVILSSTDLLKTAS